jgi:hypothetical protein
VRTALALEQPQLDQALVDGVEARTPLVGHARCAARGELTEAAEEHVEAAALYSEAVERWREFGNIPERAYALLRTGPPPGDPGESEAEEPLRPARELFASTGFAPAAGAWLQRAGWSSTEGSRQAVSRPPWSSLQPRWR